MLQLYYSGLCQVKFRRFSNKACLKTVFNKRRNAWGFRFSKRKKTFIYKIP